MLLLFRIIILATLAFQPITNSLHANAMNVMTIHRTSSMWDVLRYMLEPDYERALYGITKTQNGDPLPQVIEFDMTWANPPKPIRTLISKYFGQIPKKIFVITDAAVSKNFIFSTENKEKHEGIKITKPGSGSLTKFETLLGGLSFFLLPDQQWQNTRASIKKFLTMGNAMAKSKTIIHEEVDKIIELIREERVLQSEAISVTLLSRIISRIFFDLDDVLADTEIPKLIRDIFPAAPYAYEKNKKHREKLVENIRTLIDNLKPSDNPNLYKTLTEENGMSQEQVIDHLIGFFLAGIDTTVTALNQILNQLGSDQDMQEFLFNAENREKIIRLYTQNSIAIFPPLPSRSRTVLREMVHKIDELNFLTIPAESMVIPSPWLQTRREILMDKNGLDFMDYIGEEGLTQGCKANNYAFGDGEHGCMGQFIGMETTRYFTQKLIETFTFTIVQNKKNNPKPNMWDMVLKTNHLAILEFFDR